MLSKYKMEARVATYDTGESLTLKYSVILRLLQEAAMRQLLEEGLGYEKMRETGVVFLLTRVNLSIYSLPKSGDSVSVETWFQGLKGAQFTRDMRMVGEHGEICAEAESLWIAADPQAHKIVRPAAFPFQEVLIPYAGDRVEIEEQKITVGVLADCDAESRQVRYSDIDCNAHVNNAVYADIVCDYFPGGLTGKELSGLQIVFHNEAVIGEELLIKTAYTSPLTAIFEGKVGNTRCFEALALLSET